MRVHLFEFEDFSWFPDVIRVGGTDYLRYFLIATELYKPIIPLIHQSLVETGENKIIDLCSGGGGYIKQVYEGINQISNQEISITLTDKFPNYETYKHLNIETNGGIDFVSQPVDVFDVPKDLKGFRVLFSAVHHFRPKQIKTILSNAVESNAPIGFFDGGEKSLFVILGMMIFHPIAMFLFTPFFKPFRWSTLFFTYIIPLIPLYTVWDGCVSVLRMYTPKEFLKITEEIGADNYVWKAGKVKNRFGIKASYLIGYPKNEGK